MGGFYGSVQLRTDDRDSVIAKLDSLAEQQQFQYLVSPVLKGWVGVYPSNGGQSDRVGRAIAEAIGGISWHVMVHDDSVLAYWLYRDGALVDSYWSSPGYFGEEDRAEQEAMAGNPDLLAATVDGDADKLRALLDRTNDHVFEVERLIELGKLTGVKNLATAFEYLQAGETEGVTGAKKFIELPQSARKKKAAEKRDRLKALKKQGLLLHREEVGQDDWLQMCASREGIVVFRSHRYWDNPVKVSLCRSTTRKTERLPWSINGRVVTAMQDEGGRHAALYVCDRDKCRIQIRDVVSGELVDEIPPGISDRLCANRDLSVWATSKANHLKVFNVRDRTPLMNHNLENESHIAIHPSGEWLVTAHRGIRFKRVQQTLPWQDLPITVQVVRPDFGPSLSAYVAEFQATFADWRKAIGDIPSGIPDITSELVGGYTYLHCVGFSRDGAWLWCGGRVGVWVFRWSEIVEKGSAARAIWWHPTSPWLHLGHSINEVRSIAESGDGQSIYVGTHVGEILQLDLTNGSVRQILQLGEDHTVDQIVTSVGGAAIGCVTSGLENGTKFFMTAQIWALDALGRLAP